jgi:hypothetical protein
LHHITKLKTKKMKNRIAYKDNGNLIVFRYGKTSNKKIASPNENIVQTYTFSQEQFNYVENCLTVGEKPNFKHFFSLDGKNCGNCPLSANQNYKLGKCYTHKVMQYSGFISMLKSIVNQFQTFNNLPTFEDVKNDSFFTNKIVNTYIRFGTYGEPTKIRLELIQAITEICKDWTGYTHQYLNNKEYLNYFMASSHSEKQANSIEARSFIALTDLSTSKAVNCPASNEQGFKSNCSACGLCSGLKGKGTKNVKILVH